MNLMLDDQYTAMPWDKIDTVIFDVGNVLLSFHAKELLDKLVPERPDLHEELTIRVFRSPYWSMRDRGSASVEEVIAAMSANAPELEPYIRRIMCGWNDLAPIPEGVEVVQTCKAHGKKIYALTNYADQEFAHACESYDFFKLFDGYVVSSRLRLVKPEKEIYQHVIAALELDPARTLFIDDNVANIEAALDQSWQCICYNRPGKLEKFFVK